MLMWGQPPPAVRRLEEPMGVDIWRRSQRKIQARLRPAGQPVAAVLTWTLQLKAESQEVYASAVFACDTSPANPAGSFTARSARILRSSSTPAFFRPWMNWL